MKSLLRPLKDFLISFSLLYNQTKCKLKQPILKPLSLYEKVSELTNSQIKADIKQVTNPLNVITRIGNLKYIRDGSMFLGCR